MKFGDVVIFIENGVEYPATVLSSRLLDDHMGKNDEPLLALGFFKEVTAPGPDGKKPVVVNVVGTEQQSKLVQFRVDVAHESHAFSDDAVSKHKLVYGGPTYPGGRWKEFPISNFTGHQEAPVQ